MKNRFLAVGLAAIFFVGCTSLGRQPLAAASQASAAHGTLRADGRVSVEDFHQSLAPYGTWFTHEKYGEVWRPSGVSVRWRPYTVGHWAYTDDGWAWASDEDWGWATYHYGRWFFDAGYGWCWVPCTDWAPAWVSWRYGDGWVGWAPLSPDISCDSGLAFTGYDFDAVIPAYWYSFVEEQYFVAPQLRDHIALAARNVTLVKLTQNVTRYEVRDNRVVDRGVDVARIEKDTGRSVKRYRVVDADSPRAGRQAKGDELPVFRPDASKGRPAEAAHQPSTNKTRQADVPRADTERQTKAMERQQKDEERQLERQQRDEAKALEKQQRQERARPPAGMSAEDLGRRHDEERRALGEQTHRETQLLNNMHSMQRGGGAGAGRRRP